MGDETWICITRVLTYLAALFMACVAVTVWVLIFVSDNIRPIQLIESAYYVYFIAINVDSSASSWSWLIWATNGSLGSSASSTPSSVAASSAACIMRGGMVDRVAVFAAGSASMITDDGDGGKVMRVVFYALAICLGVLGVLFIIFGYATVQSGSTV